MQHTRHLTKAQSAAQNLLVAGIIVGLLTCLGSTADLLGHLSFGQRAFRIRSVEHAVRMTYDAVRIFPAIAMVVGCVLGLRRARRARTWLRVALVAFLARELVDVVVLGASMAVDVKPQYLAMMIFWAVSYTHLTLPTIYSV